MKGGEKGTGQKNTKGTEESTDFGGYHICRKKVLKHDQHRVRLWA